MLFLFTPSYVLCFDFVYTSGVIFRTLVWLWQYMNCMFKLSGLPLFTVVTFSVRSYLLPFWNGTFIGIGVNPHFWECDRKTHICPFSILLILFSFPLVVEERWALQQNFHIHVRAVTELTTGRWGGQICRSRPLDILLQTLNCIALLWQEWMHHITFCWNV